MVCSSCGTLHNAPFKPQQEDRECECGGLRVAPFQAKPRKPIQRRSSPVKRSGRPASDIGVPRWLGEGFAAGVDHRATIEALTERESYDCWLAQFDPEERPCTYKLERFHFISRQRVEKGLGVSLSGAWIDYEDGFTTLDDLPAFRGELVQLAEWDDRNGGIGCEGHHRRFDSHTTPPLTVPAAALPSHVQEFIEDWGLELEAERKFTPLTTGAPSSRLSDHTEGER